MHMADALLAPAVAATMYATSACAAGYSINKVRKEDLSEKLPVMGVAAALVFAGQMINYTIPGTGSSGHMCGGLMLSALLGPECGFLSMIVILAIQCLFFGDGGLMALGANVWNMAFYGCFIGYYLIWRPIMKSKMLNGKPFAYRGKIVLGSILGCVLTLQLGAFSVVLETLVSGITELPFAAFAGLMQPIHLAIGLVEGLVTAAVLIFVYESRPSLIRELDTKQNGVKERAGLKTVIIALSAVVVLTAGLFSLFASSNPDGLEWSLFGNKEAGYSENMGLDEENYGVSSSVSDVAGAIQDTTAFMPDYAFPNSEAAVGTSVAGIVGSAMVAAVMLLAFGLKYFLKRKEA